MKKKTASPISIRKLTQIVESGFAAVATDIAESKKEMLEHFVRMEGRLLSIEQELKDIKRRLTVLENQIDRVDSKHKKEIEELWKHVVAIEKRLKMQRA